METAEVDRNSTYDKLSKGKSLQSLSRDIIDSLYEIQAII